MAKTKERMRSYWLKKLVRDKAVETMRNKGAEVFSRILSAEESLACLQDKLKEEIDELAAADTVEEKAEELADMLEIMEAYTNALGIRFSNLKKIQEKKRESRGGFVRMEYVEYISTPPDSHFDVYCSAVPEKYPVKSD